MKHDSCLSCVFCIKSWLFTQSEKHTVDCQDSEDVILAEDGKITIQQREGAAIYEQVLDHVYQRPFFSVKTIKRIGRPLQLTDLLNIMLY